MKLSRALFVLMLSVLCHSCASSPPRPPSDQLERLWQAHESALLPIQHWELRGRLAVRVEERGGQASLTWKRSAAQQDIRLNGPLGRGAVRVTQNEAGARLQDSEQRVFLASNAEALLYDYTSWRLPLTNLNFWVRGVPVPGLSSSQELDDAGRLLTLRQQGWLVQYQGYVQSGAHVLPNRLTLTYSANPMNLDTPPMEVRIVIDRWVQVQ